MTDPSRARTSRGRRLLAAAALAALLAGGDASAQVTAKRVGQPAISSANFTLERPTLPSTGGLAASETLVTELTAGHAVEDGTASSANFRLDAGLFQQDSALYAGTAPVLTGVVPGQGDKAGGEQVAVVGYNLNRDMPAQTSVLFGSLPATNLVPIGRTAVLVTTPSGENAFGNPVAATDVEFANTLGLSARDDAFLYLPALLQEGVARVDGQIRLLYHGAPGTFVRVLAGIGTPGFGQKAGPLGGMLELLPGYVGIGPDLFAPGGYARFVSAVPAARNFPGAVLEFQAISVTFRGGAASPGGMQVTPETGLFTNRLTITIQP